MFEIVALMIGDVDPCYNRAYDEPSPIRGNVHREEWPREACFDRAAATVLYFSKRTN
jgi:hypothetical protein